MLKTQQYMANKRKTLTVTVTDTEEGIITSFKAKKLSDFEIIGILSYYLDAYKVKMMRSSEDLKNQEEDGSEA
jgi:hypothetical protein